MKNVPARFTLAVLLMTAPLLHAQEFYGDMLQRGVSDALAGAWGRAANELRVAAFGSMDNMPAYMAAQVYLAVANDHLDRREDARAAAAKAVQAERLSPVYARASIDSATRQAFERLLPKLLNAERYAGLPAFSHAPGAVAVTHALPPDIAPTPVATAVPVPAPVTTTRVPVAAPLPVAPAPVAQTPITMPVTAAPVPAARAGKPAPPPPPATASVTAKPVPQPPAPRPMPQPVVIDAQQPLLRQPMPQPQPVPQPAAPIQSALAAAAKHPPSQSSHFADVATRLSQAQRLLNEGRMLAAREEFLSIGRTAGASRTALLDAAKGLTQTNAWYDSSVLYSKLFPLQKGEETNYFYEAVNRFELGEVTSARDLLNRALPYMGNSREVALYRGRIEGTVQ